MCVYIHIYIQIDAHAYIYIHIYMCVCVMFLQTKWKGSSTGWPGKGCCEAQTSGQGQVTKQVTDPTRLKRNVSGATQTVSASLG